jgi:hypothetical protein
LRAAGLVAAIAVAAAPLPAQGPPPVYLRADAEVTSKYVWRGITRSQFPTMQAHGLIAVQAGRIRLAGGAFASYEPFRAGQGERTLAGIGERGVGEADYWGEVSLVSREVEVAAGLIRYTFHGDAALLGRSSAANTTELFARLDARGVSFSPSLTAWVDLEDVRGTYLEFSGVAPVLGWPYRREPLFVTVDAELGVSLGQQEDVAAGRRGHFAGNGPTHLQLGLTALRGLAPWMDLTVACRGQLGFDDAVRMGADGERRGFKGWMTIAAVMRPARRGGR